MRTRTDFRKLVEEALKRIPARFARFLNNVQIVIEYEPTPEQLHENGVEESNELFGLYEGIPQTERGNGYNLALPDKITIFQRPHEELGTSEDELRDEIAHTILHEIAHHFGIDDKRLEELGKY